MWSLILSLIFSIPVVSAFNVDTNIPIVKIGTRGSYFGFSVAQHQIDGRSGVPSTFMILVGAPKDNVTSSDPVVSRIVRPGQVYSCPVTSLDDDCKAIKLVTSQTINDNLTDQWLGVSVASQGSKGGRAVACAHRFKYVARAAVRGLGLCYKMSNSLDFDEFAEPCFGETDNNEQQFGNCLAGTSVAVSRAGDLLVGTPRAWAGRGGVFKDLIEGSGLDDSGGWIRNPISGKIENATCLIDSYLGMTSKIGSILPGDHPTYMAGAPRSRKNGEVIFFQEDSRIISGKPSDFLKTTESLRLRGDQFGSGYGYNIEVVDINGDYKDDLVVGAPYYHGSNIGGAIYVYLNAGGEETISRDTKPTIILSREMPRSECEALNCENAQFGISIANIGDIDLDSYQDIAVGAPYEGAGCVYIFRGSDSGIIPQYSQRICAEDLPSARPLFTFGYSLGGGSDVDNNGLPDIAVGAYDSNKMLILRSRPVITIKALMQSQPGRINPSKTQCAIDGESNNCFKIRACFKYSIQPKHRDNQRSTNPVIINYRLEAETFTGKAISRVVFKGRPGRTNRHITEGTKQLARPEVDHECEEEIAYLSRTNSDFLNPIQFRLTYSLGSTSVPVMRRGEPLPNINNYPVINEAAAEETLSVEFENDCGGDNTCHSNLELSAYFEGLDLNEDGVAVLKVGQIRELKLNVQVNNLGEDAHKTTLAVLLPDRDSFSFIQASPRKIGCVPNEEGMEVICSKIGNPLPKGQSSNFVIRLDPVNISPTQKLLNIKLRVNTTSEETDTSNDFETLTIKVVMETDVIVRGSSSPSEMFYGGAVRGESSIKYEDEIGGHVLHTYQVLNDGRSWVPNATLWISWPYEVENGFSQGKHLLYLMTEPEVQPPAVCYTPPGMVNPLGIKVNGDYSKSLKDKLEIRQNDASKKGVYQYDERDYKSDGTKDGSNHAQALRRRVKRENVIQPEWIMYQDRRVKVVILDCDTRTAKCFKIRCELGEMSPDQSITIKLRARLWNSTFLEDYRNVDHVQIFSKGRLEINPALNVQQPTHNDIERVMLKAVPDISSVEQPGVPLWVYVLAGFAGLVVLIVIILLLWKCGFFKRRTPTDMRKTRHYKKMKYKSPGNDEDFYS